MKTFSKLLLFVAVLAIPFAGCKEEDPCEGVTCLNGGTCADGSCDCPAGYTGSNCGTEVRAKFIGTYNVTEACTSGNYTYTMSATASSSGILNIVFSNFAGVGATINATANGNSLTIPNQTVDVSGVSATFSGSGQIAGNILTISYTLSAGGTTDPCTATCTKQ